MLRRVLFGFLAIIFAIYAAGCQTSRLSANTRTTNLVPNNTNYTDKYRDSMLKVASSNGDKAGVISSVETIYKEVSLTFDGMGDENSVSQILDQLDKNNIKATFFLPGVRVAEEPDIAKKILQRGHTLGNNTLNKKDLTNLGYDEILKEIKLSHDVIARETGVEPTLLRTKFAYYNDDILKAAAQCGYKNIITYSINPQDWDGKSPQQIAEIVEKRLVKGGIIMLNADTGKNVAESIPLIKKVLEERGYKVVALEQLQQDKLPEIKVSNSGELQKNTSILQNITYAYTTKPEMALTFDGLGDKNMVMRILEQLDKYNIKATFFVPGLRAGEDPELVREILIRGHSIEDNTFKKLDMTKLSFDEIYRDLMLSREYIEKATGKAPRFVRPEFGKVDDTFLKAAAQCGYESAVTYTVNPLDKNMKSAQDIAEVVEKSISRGRIILLNTEYNPSVIDAIPLIAKAVSEAGQKLVPLEELLAGQYQILPDDKIPGFYDAKVVSDYQNAQYTEAYDAPKESMKVAITFDDWANDVYLTKLLNVLRKYNVKSTFFVRANGVERTPNLARLIFEEGHEVANHSYSHKVSTDITTEELQEDVVKCHQILSKYLGQAPAMYFRPPTGVIDDLHSKAVAASGYKVIILYDVSPQDWRPEKTVDNIVQSTLSAVTPGSNIVLHLQDSTKTAEALDIIIQKLKSQGYELVTVTELLKQ